MTEKEALMNAELRQLAASRAKTGDQKFVTPEELVVIAAHGISRDSKPRDLGKGSRAACSCCGKMSRKIFDRRRFLFCPRCVKAARCN